MSGIKDALTEFGNQVVGRSRANLRAKDINASGNLSKSLRYEVKPYKKDYRIRLFGADYGEFIDKGVKGTAKPGERKLSVNADGTKARPGDGKQRAPWKIKNAKGSPYSFKSKQPPRVAFNGWTIRRGIAPRDAGGRFTRRTGLLHALSYSVFKQGIERTDFFTDALNREKKKLMKNLIDGFRDDLLDEFNFDSW